MRHKPPLSPCVMVACALSTLMICGTCSSLWLGINGAIRILGSLLCAFPPFPMICTLILFLCALIVNLWTINSCPYYNIFDACYARLNVVIETMNEQYECFVGEMRECGLLHETIPSLSSPMLKVTLDDAYESSLPLKPDFIAHTPLPGLKEVINPPFVAPSLSSTLKDITEGI